MNSKLLVVTNDYSNHASRSVAAATPALVRCDLDGTGCTYTDISAGQGANSGGTPSAMIDTVNKKLLVVTQNGANSYKPALFRCNLDGTGCTYRDISAGQDKLDQDSPPSAVIDTSNAKLLVVTTLGDTYGISNKPSLFRCNLGRGARSRTFRPAKSQATASCPRR
jgi:hypothetical protein